MKIEQSCNHETQRSSTVFTFKRKVNYDFVYCPLILSRKSHSYDTRKKTLYNVYIEVSILIHRVRLVLGQSSPLNEKFN
jgi:hypothetical protein